MIAAVLLLGGNVGRVERTFEAVRAEIEREVGHITACSSVMQSEAWGFDADPFLNQAVVVETELEPLSLLGATQRIEERAGRGREAEIKRKNESGERYLSRTIDIDIIFYGDRVVECERLTIPHLLIAKRRFALEPIAEIASHLVHAKNGKSVEQMLNELED